MNDLLTKPNSAIPPITARIASLDLSVADWEPMAAEIAVGNGAGGNSMIQPALKYETKVTMDGRVELHLPLPAGARVIVFVIEQAADAMDDLVAAAQSNLAFWDNPLDDEDWDHVWAGR